MFLYDTHVHTSEVSPCSEVSAERLVQLYIAAGYDGIVITDHYAPGICDPEDEAGLTHKMAVERYLLGYENAKKAAAGRLTVLLGMELRFHGMNNDFLVFGMTEEFLWKYPDIRRMNPRSFHSLSKKEGLLFFSAHPFRNAMTVISSDCIDGVEIMNGHPRHDSRNYLAKAFAEKSNLLKSSGSDCHAVGEEARGGIIVKERIQNNEDLVKCLRHQPLLVT